MLKWLLAAVCVFAVPLALNAQAPVDTVWMPADTVWVPGDTTWLPADTVWVPSDTVFIQPPPDTVQLPDVTMPSDTVYRFLPPDTVWIDPDPPVDPPDPPVDPPDGRSWRTTFDGIEGTTYPDPLPGNLSWQGENRSGANQAVVTAAANRAAGGGALGMRYYYLPGSDAGSNVLSVDFSGLGFGAQEQEFWFRFYLRYDAGFSWSRLVYEKIAYARTQTQINFWEFHPSSFHFGTKGGVTTTDPGTGWNDVITPGEWFCFEAHVKMDTDQTDGIGQVWMNGVLVMDRDDLDWSGGDATARRGWVTLFVPSNQYNPSASGMPAGGWPLDYDDMALYFTTPPNVDAQGNPMIGPLP